MSACTSEHVTQMEQAMQSIYRQHSQGYRHDSARQYQILDVDRSGMPCGKKAAFGSPGYVAKQRNRRGRQLGRVLASRYEEVVVDRLFDGTTQLTKALQPLIEAAEQTLGLDQQQRERTLVRTDAGGGSVDDVNWLLVRGYQFHGKDDSTARARRLAHSVQHWIEDPQVQGRQVGWVCLPATEYVRPVRRIAVRCRKANGQWGIGVLISTLTPAQVLALTQPEASPNAEAATVRLSYVSLYDQRGGGVETSFKGDHQGLGSTKRSKKRGSRATDGDVVGQPGPPCRHLGSSVADAGCCVQQAAARWDPAYGARCVPYQWLSDLRCLGPSRPDCAEPSSTFGTHFSRVVAGALDPYPCRR